MASSVVATEDVIQASIKDTAEKIAKEYAGQLHRDTTTDTAAEAPISYDNPLIVISVLKGSYIFTADFVRYLGDHGLPHVVDFVRLASYNDGTQSTGYVKVLLDTKYTNLQGKHVLIVEDVCDSGRTLQFFSEQLKARFQPKSLKTVVLVRKEASARRVVYEPEYWCLNGPDKYIVGYGFEVNDRYRDLRHIFVLKDGEATRYPTKL